MIGVVVEVVVELQYSCPLLFLLLLEIDTQQHPPNVFSLPPVHPRQRHRALIEVVLVTDFCAMTDHYAIMTAVSK